MSLEYVSKLNQEGPCETFAFHVSNDRSALFRAVFGSINANKVLVDDQMHEATLEHLEDEEIDEDIDYARGDVGSNF